MWNIWNPLFLPPTKEVYAIARDVCLSVCLLARLLRNSMHGFVWNFASGQMSGRGQTDQLLSPIQIILRMPEPENLKIADLSKSVKQAPHSEQATGHGKHCREILFTPRCSPRARELRRSVDFSVRRTVAELRGVKLAEFSDFDLCWRYMRSTECHSSYIVVHCTWVVLSRHELEFIKKIKLALFLWPTVYFIERLLNVHRVISTEINVRHTGGPAQH